MLHGIHDADDGRFGGNFVRQKRKASFLAAAPIDGFAHARTNGIESYERAASFAALRIERLHERDARTNAIGG